MPITLRLTAPITDGDAVGTLVAARVSEDVARREGIVVPDGSLVRGRIRRLERCKADAQLPCVLSLQKWTWMADRCAFTQILSG